MAKCIACRRSAPLFDSEGARTHAIQMGLKVVCNFECQQLAIPKLAKKAREKREKLERKAGKEALAVLDQTVKHWRPKADTAFQLFSRLSDYGQGCISCGITYGEVHGGHYISKGSKKTLTRYAEDNCNSQCSQCNNKLSGNVALYRVNLVKKIGQYRVDILEGPMPLVNWLWDDYKAVYDWYNKLNKVLRNEIEQRIESDI